jgi:dipeptidyl aminopeptidase/acylaminoacyl peptidase
MAVFSEEAVTLWAVSDWSLILKTKLQGAGVDEAELSPTGAWLALALTNNSLEFYRIGNSGDPVTVSNAHENLVRHLSFSPDETMLLSASADATVKVWDVSSGRARLPAMQHEGVAYWAEFSADGRRIVTASDDQAVVWDIEPHQRLVATMAHPYKVRMARFSPVPDRKSVLTVCDDGVIRLWDPETGVLQTQTGPSLLCSDNAEPVFSTDGREVLTVLADRQVTLLRCIGGSHHVIPVQESSSIPTNMATRPSQPVGFDLHAFEPLHTGGITAWDIAPHGHRIATGARDGTVLISDLQTRQPRSNPLVHHATVSSVRFSPDGLRLVMRFQEALAHQG